MSFKIKNKLHKLNSLLFFLSLINLFIISLIPWISVVENDSKDELYLNKIMMERSGNIQIKNISNILNYIIYLLWIIIILTTISYISFNAYFSEIYPLFAKIMKNNGFVVLIINVINIYLQINLINNIEGMYTISLAYISPVIKFAYIPLIFGFFLLIVSIFYSKIVIFDFIKKRKNLKNKNTQNHEKSLFYKPKIFPEEELISDKIFEEFRLGTKDIKKNYWSEAEQEQKIGLELKSEPKLSETTKDIEMEKSIENKSEEVKFTKTDEKNNFNPFPSEKSKDKSKESDVLPISDQFEKALSSAIEKKQIELKRQTDSDKNTEIKNKKNEKEISQIDVEIEKISDFFNNEKNKQKKKK